MLPVVVVLLYLSFANAHLAAWHRAMYCLDGVSGRVDLNSAAPVTPLYQLPRRDWWFHHINKCDEFPPAPGVFLDLPAGGEFQVEIASNRAKTSLSYNGRDMSDWPDGRTYPENYNVPSCITSPNMHTQNQSMAAGTAFAISYQSDISKVTPENLAVFSVKYHTPWKRVTRYAVPAAMPACPPEGCICAWGWIPNGCGQPNMYHQAFRCRVTGAQSTTPVAAPKPPVWCEGEPDKCTKGAKQMLYWNQRDGNNIAVSGLDRSGAPKSPGYNMKCGFADGAQNDIFDGPSSSGNPPQRLNPIPGPEAPSDPAPSSDSEDDSPSTSSPTQVAAVVVSSPAPSPTYLPGPPNAASPTYLPSAPRPAPACRRSKTRKARAARSKVKRRDSDSSSGPQKKRRGLRRIRLSRTPW